MDCNKSKQHQFVSIIVPTFNRKTELEQCVKSLLNLTYKDYEIIIVDDGSSDGTEELIRGLDANIVYIRQKNAGPAVARNTGIQHMKGEFAVFTDSDCIVDKKWLEELMVLFANDDVGMVGGVTIENKKTRILNNIVEKVSNNPEYLPTNNIAFRYELLKDINGFNTSFYFPAGEDVDICFRLRKIGYGIKVANKARIIHCDPKSFINWLCRNFCFGMANKIILENHIERKIFCPYYFFVIPLIALRDTVKQAISTKRITNFFIVLFLRFIARFFSYAGEVYYSCSRKKYALLLYRTSYKLYAD